MAKPKKSRKYAGKSEDEWKSIGLKFGKGMDRMSNKMEGLSDKFNERMERRGAGLEERWSRPWRMSWEEGWSRPWRRTFSVFGPLISGVFGLIFLLFGVLILNFINLSVHSYFAYAVSNFILTNLPLLFAASLFFGYCRQLSRMSSGMRKVVKPISISAAIVFAAWIAIFVLDLIDVYISNPYIAAISLFLSQNLLVIFVFFLAVCYFLVLLKEIVRKSWGWS